MVAVKPKHIAEREQAEAAMRESECKYRNLFEHLSDAAFLVDVESGRILDTNSQGERLLGRTRGEIMGMNQSKRYRPDKEQEARERFAGKLRHDFTRRRVTAYWAPRCWRPF